MRRESSASASPTSSARSRSTSAERRTLVAALIAMIAMVVAVGGAPSRASAASPDDDEVTPLVITTLGNDPIPVKGSDGKFHVAYELSVLNYHTGAAVLTSLDTVAPDGRVVISWSEEHIRAVTVVVPVQSLSGAPATGIPPGATAVLILEDVYPDRASIPRSVTHRIAATFDSAASTATARVKFFPANVTETGGRVTTSTKQAVVLSPPVRGDSWGGFACCDQVNAHRGAMLPIGGEIRGTERFAIDFGVLSQSTTPPTTATDVWQLEPGTDGTKNEDYTGYGTPLLAVADGTVVKVVDDVPDTPPGPAPSSDEGLAVNEAGGNVVVLRIAPHLFAFYLHNKPGSAVVKEGDRVKEGQQLAELGSSGNSLAPHLHFQLGRSRQMLTTENVPYVFERFTVQGTLSDDGFAPDPTPTPHEDELPLWDDVVDFPG
jgi:murein DD-endopeptidase MepM/ murein hydrolase activator NlpD